MRVWLQRMGIPHGQVLRRGEGPGRSPEHLQTDVLLRRSSGSTGFTNERIIDGGLMMLDEEAGDGRQGSLFVEGVQLSELFYSALKKHPVPIWNQPYGTSRQQHGAGPARLARLPTTHPLEADTGALGSPTRAVRSGVKAQRHFRPTFISNLRLALARTPTPGSMSRRPGSSSTHPVPQWRRSPDDQPVDSTAHRPQWARKNPRVRQMIEVRRPTNGAPVAIRAGINARTHPRLSLQPLTLGRYRGS